MNLGPLPRGESGPASRDRVRGLLRLPKKPDSKSQIVDLKLLVLLQRAAYKNVGADLEHALNHQRGGTGLYLRQAGRNHQLGQLVAEGSGLQARNLPAFGELPGSLRTGPAPCWGDGQDISFNPPRLSTALLKFGNVFPEPPHLARPGWCPVPTGSREKRRRRATLSRKGRGSHSSILTFLNFHPSIEPHPSPLAGEGARPVGQSLWAARRGTRAGEGS
jgi:hypothetical protein